MLPICIERTDTQRRINMIDRCKPKEKEKGGVRYCDCAPDNISYNLLLDVHAKSDEANAGNRGLDILSAWNRQAI
jgi:hypothetical protein